MFVNGVAPDLRARLRDLGVDPQQRLGIAVSGGPDSLALALMGHHQGLDLHAYVVDHGMRAEAAAEASWTAAQLYERGIPAEILTIEAPLSGMASARDARYRAILERMEARFLLVGHHLNDQLETVAMRLERGSGLRGLAGMSARNGRVVRPLLDQPKVGLVGYCQAARQKYLADPSNNNVSYRRPFWRTALAADEQLGADLLGLQASCARLRRWTETQAVAVLDLVEMKEEGMGQGINLALDALPACPQVRVELLRRAIAAVSGRYDGDFDPLTLPLGKTGFGCTFSQRKGGLLVRRDSRRQSPQGSSDTCAAIERLDRSVFSIVSGP